MKIGLWTLGISLGGFLLWATLTPLDEGVPTHGMVTIDTKRKAIQHLTGGIVKQVYVKEGQFVKAGEPLLRLDEAAVFANYEGVRQHYLTVRAMEGRLMAEQTGLHEIVFHPDLMQTSRDPIFKQTMGNQAQLFRSRHLAHMAEMQAMQEMMLGQEASIKGYEGMLAGRKSKQGLLQEELQGVRELVSEGYAPRNKLLELERMTAESTGSIIDLQGKIQQGRNNIAEMRMRANQSNQEFKKEVHAQLSEVLREVGADAEKLKAISQELERMVIRAPVEGQVVGLAVQSVGAIIGAGQKILDVVPVNETLLLEAKVPPNFIDLVHPGSQTDVRFSSFAHSPALVVLGKLESISSDLIVEPQTNVAYYLARISISADGRKELGNRQLLAGMPVEIIIKTGERSMLSYLLHPLLKRITEQEIPLQYLSQLSE